jgi:hypothetical protein
MHSIQMLTVRVICTIQLTDEISTCSPSSCELIFAWLDYASSVITHEVSQIKVYHTNLKQYPRNNFII